MIGVDKTLAVAQAELRALLRSKAFLISLGLLPLMLLGMSSLSRRLSERADPTPRRFAIVDASGRFADVIVAAARARNLALDAAGGARPRFVPERATDGPPREATRLALSERVRREELYAFVEIPSEPDREPLRYCSDHPAYDELREWLATTVDDALRAERYRAARLDPALVEALGRHVRADSLGLYTRDARGRVREAERQDLLRALLVPLVPAFLLFFFVAISSPQLMHSVLTEKLSRISEVLLGSLSPVELMAGKLLGSVAVSLMLGAAYALGGLVVAERAGLTALIPTAQVAWFFWFLLLAMLLYGALCIAIGAACSDLKDAQNLMLPVLLPLTAPMMLAATVIQAPSSPLAVGLSLFPLSAPIMMLLRLGLHPAPPAWQVALAQVTTLATTAGCVWAAGRIFRVGLLSQGKSASVGQMLRWIFTR